LRVAAIFVALVGVALLGSIPGDIADYLRESSRHSLGAVANGTVVEVARSGQGFSATIEYRRGADPAVVKIQREVAGVGYLWRRSSLQVGDPVLVGFDPARPDEARILSIGPIWWSVVRRAAGGVVLVIAALAMFVGVGRKRRAGAHAVDQPVAAEAVRSPQRREVV
jgi:hypothetical protein